MTMHEEFVNLVRATLQHLQEEYPKEKYLFVEKESYHYYRNYAMQRAQKKPSPAPQTVRIAIKEGPAVQMKAAPKRAEPRPEAAKKTVIETKEVSTPTASEPLFKLEPLTAAPADTFADMRKMVNAAIPSLRLLSPKNE